MPPCTRNDKMTKWNDILWNVIFTGDKGGRWVYFDHCEISFLLEKEARQLRKRFVWGWMTSNKMTVRWREQLRKLQTGKQVKSAQAFYNQMLEWGVNVSPPVMTLTFIVIIRQTQKTSLLSFISTSSCSRYIISIVVQTVNHSIAY